MHDKTNDDLPTMLPLATVLDEKDAQRFNFMTIDFYDMSSTEQELD